MSARLERFLGLCAEDNMQVYNLTTPADLSLHAAAYDPHDSEADGDYVAQEPPATPRGGLHVDGARERHLPAVHSGPNGA